MRRQFVFFLVVLFGMVGFASVGCAAGHAELSSLKFFSYPAVDPSVVIRQQLIDLKPQQLADAGKKSVPVRLFNNVSVDLVLKSQQKRVQGSIFRQGKISGYPNSHVLLVIKGDRITGEIAFSDILYHIRTLKNGSHIAQEIKTTRMGKGKTNDVITLTNQERAKYGKPALAANARLAQAAQGHAEDMAQHNYFAHAGLDGHSPADRITAAGYQWNSYAENIADGSSTAAATVNQWINSPGHHANMLSDTVCDLGVGYAYNNGATNKYYWVQDFGRKQGVTTCPATPAPAATARPDVDSGRAEWAGGDAMRFQGTINPHGLSTRYVVQIGRTTAYGWTSSAHDAGSGTGPMAVSLQISGLTEGVTYHYRFVAQNSVGISYGSDVAFQLRRQAGIPQGVVMLLLGGKKTQSAVKTVSSSEGGKIAIPSGASLQVVGGTVPHNQSGGSARVTFSIESPVPAPVPLDGGGRFVGNLVRFGPEGFNFSWPVKMSLPYPANMDPIGLHVVHYNETLESWQIVAVSGGNNHFLSFDALQLGIYGVADFSSSSRATRSSAGKAGDFILKDWHDSADGGFVFYNPTYYGSNEYYYTLTVLAVAHFKYPDQDTAYNRRWLIGSSASLGQDSTGDIIAKAVTISLPQATYSFWVSRERKGTSWRLPGPVETYSLPIVATTDEAVHCGQWASVAANFSDGCSPWVELHLPAGGTWGQGPPTVWPAPTVPYGTGDFQATLTWINNSSHATDMDLHLYGPGGMHVYYGNEESTDGSLQHDRDWMTEQGNAVENIYSLNAMPSGSYRVIVNKYSGDSVHYRVRIIDRGKVTTYNGYAQGDNETTVYTFGR